MSDTFKHGDHVFAANGEWAVYIAASPDGHVVSPLYSDRETGEPTYSEESVYLTSTVTAEPPVEAKNATIAKLDAQIIERNEQLKKLRETLAAEEKTAKARHAELLKWSGLQTLEDFIAGRITHLVFIDNYSGPRIQTFAKGMEYSETEYEKTRILGMKLLTLFGHSNGDLTWQIYKYRDPSSSTDYEVRPATSYEEAVEIARKYWNEEMDSRRAKGFMPGGDWVKNGTALGFEVPADLAEKMRISAIANAKDYLTKAETELATRRAALAALEVGVVPVKTDGGVI